MQVSTKSPIIIASSRGARFLDLVKQNKLNVSPQLSKRRFSLCDAFKKDRNEAQQKKNAPEEKDYLKFSSQLKFNPNASPSSSILSKRKAEAPTPDSSPLASSSKRKRVGFRDPVSSTKEYLITAEEERSKSSSLIRCLSYDNEADADEEPEEAVKEHLDEHKGNVIAIKEEADDNVDFTIEIEEAIIETPGIVDHDYDESPQHTDITTSDDSMQSVSDNKLTFNNKNELMDYIAKNLTVDELFQKLTQAEEESIKRKELISKVIKSVGFNGLLNEYFDANSSQTTKLSSDQSVFISSILSEISKLMQSNQNVKHKVLELLSEKHSDDLLSHALQENSTTAVCDKIAIANVVNYLIHKVNIAETDENDEHINRLNRSMLHHLVNNTHNAGKEIVPDTKETHELMRLLFKSTPKKEIFDTVYDFLRKLL